MMSEELKSFLERTEVKQINARLESLIHKKQTAELIVVFCGIFSAGKSSIINELLQQEFKLPTGTKPVTKFITRIAYGTRFEAFCICADRNVMLGKEQTRKVLEGTQKPPEGCREILLKMPAEILKPNVVFLDTPGFQDDAALEHVTRRAVRAADMAVFCCHAGHFGRHFEQEYFQELEESLGNFCVVVNHADELHTKEEFQQVQDYVKNMAAGRGVKQLGKLTDVTTFFTVGAGKYADLDGLDQFLLKLRNAQETEWQRLKKYAHRKKISYGLKLLLPEVEQGIRIGQEVLHNVRQKKEKEYQEEMEQYKRECCRIERLIELEKQSCQALLDGQFRVIEGKLEALERKGNHAGFVDEASSIIKAQVMMVPDVLQSWREKEGLAQSYQVADPGTRFLIALLGYSVPAPQGKKVKKRGVIESGFVSLISQAYIMSDPPFWDDGYDVEYHGYAAAAASHIRNNLAPELRAALEEYLTCVAEESMPKEPEPEAGLLKEIEWNLEDWHILKRKVMLYYEKSG